MTQCVNITEERAAFVTVMHGMRGYFPVLVVWNTDFGGFYEPEQSGPASFADAKDAAAAARAWARDEGLEFKPNSR